MKMILAMMISLITPLVAKGQPSDLSQALKKSFTSRSAKFPKVDADALKGDDRIGALLDLRYLMEMEGILRELRHDGATLKKQVAVEDFSGSEKSRLIKLRAEAVEHQTHSLVTKGFKEPRTSPVKKLNKAYERKSKKPLSEISQNQKTRDKELDRTRPDERRISKLESAIEADEKIIAKIQTAFYGGVPVKGFEAPFEGNAEGAVASLLTKVIAARDQLLKTLRLDPKQALAKDGEVKKGNVGGIQIRSSNLGVILDNSSSMQPHIPELRKEIDGGFPGSHFREVYGCALTWRAGPTKPGSKRDLVILAMEDLIIVKQTDALYWFSDLRDPQTEAGLVHLGDLLQRSGALFYVASVDQKPENELEDLITEFKKK
jgi:hypothetical protein